MEFATSTGQRFSWGVWAEFCLYKTEVSFRDVRLIYTPEAAKPDTIVTEEEIKIPQVIAVLLSENVIKVILN